MIRLFLKLDQSLINHFYSTNYILEYVKVCSQLRDKTHPGLCQEEERQKQAKQVHDEEGVGAFSAVLDRRQYQPLRSEDEQGHRVCLQS